MKTTLIRQSKKRTFRGVPTGGVFILKDLWFIKCLDVVSDMSIAACIGTNPGVSSVNNLGTLTRLADDVEVGYVLETELKGTLE